ncbi:MAG: tetratricopeptide repeat protein, partial [Spartobacteria bacterium]
MYDKAFHAFDAGDYNEALKALDAIDARQPKLAESLNLRGVVYMRQGDYDKAEAVFRKALSIEPRFWNASFNLAEIPFRQKNWAEARNRFEVLMAGESDGMLPETSQLIQYKILLTFVLQGNEKTVDWILNKFELAKDSPALYYANAAIAFQHGNAKEAQDWMTAAQKKFSAPLNKLYTESFYDIGWVRKPAGEPRAALEITSSTERAERMKADAQAHLEGAERAFQQRDFGRALKSLEDVEEGMPNEPAAINLRGEILMEQKKLDEAEGMFQKALAANPEFREAKYNLALILFKKGDYSKSRDRFEALYSETPGGEKNQAAQLIKFNVFLTLLLEGKEAEARQLMEQFKFTGETPALYYAQAAWEFRHDGMERGADWVASARKIYSPALNMIFADSFDGLGWLKETKTETTPVTSALAQANASPAQGPKPAMRFGAAETNRPLETSEGWAAVRDEATPEIGAVAATPVSAPILAAKPTAPPNVAPTTRAAAKPAPKALASEKVRPWSWQAFSERYRFVSHPRDLLVAGLVLTGLALLVLLAVRQRRGAVSSAIAVGSGEPSTDPSLSGESALGDEEKFISPDLLSGGPYRASIELKGCEPFILKPGVSLSGIMAGASAAEVAAPAA